MDRNRWCGLACVGGLFLLCATGARASEQQNARWQVRVVPYAWGAAASGDVRLRGLPPVAFERSFSDTLSDLELGGMLVLEARRGDWGLLSDLTYVETSQGVRFPSLGIDGTFQTRLATGALLASYRAVDTPGWSLDVLGGARHWDIGLQAQLDAPVSVERRADTAWTDPLLGLRFAWHPSPRHVATVWAIGGVRDGVPLDVLASYGYGVRPNLWLRIGYRHMSARHRRDGLDVDLSLAGPGAGLEFRF